MTIPVVQVGVLGCGTVGSHVIRLLFDHGEDIARRADCRILVSGVAVRDLNADRDVPLPGGLNLFTSDAEALVKSPDVDVVVELIGGVEPARSLILAAFAEHKPVVTANKELLANHGRELFDAAEAAGADLYFEAAVGGGIPLIRPLKESLAGERILRVTGIVNGTTNYILTRMTEDGMSFPEALDEAARLGYAEADPTDDVDGADAAAKCAILGSIAFNARIVAGDVYREGIRGVTKEDVTFADRLGYLVKLLAIAELTDGDVSVRVHPAMVPRDHPLASVRENFNAVFVEGETVGELMFYGRGAGGAPTATAVVGDIVDVARNLTTGGRGVGCTCYEERRVRPIDDIDGQFYLLLEVADRPGVLARVAQAFGDNGVSIKSVWQEGRGDSAELVLVTHRANEGSMRRTVEQAKGLDVVSAVKSVLRVAGEE